MFSVKKSLYYNTCSPSVCVFVYRSVCLPVCVFANSAVTSGRINLIFGGNVQPIPRFNMKYLSCLKSKVKATIYVKVTWLRTLKKLKFYPTYYILHTLKVMLSISHFVNKHVPSNDFIISLGALFHPLGVPPMSHTQKSCFF